MYGNGSPRSATPTNTEIEAILKKYIFSPTSFAQNFDFVQCLKLKNYDRISLSPRALGFTQTDFIKVIS